MYNTKLNEIYTDTDVQAALIDLSERCEKDGILCKVWGSIPMQRRSGRSLVIPGLLIGESYEMLEPYFDKYEDMICEFVVGDSDMVMTDTSDPTILCKNTRVNICKEGVPL